MQILSMYLYVFKSLRLEARKIFCRLQTQFYWLCSFYKYNYKTETRQSNIPIFSDSEFGWRKKSNIPVN
jgi:hypothetical protein